MQDSRDTCNVGNKTQNEEKQNNSTTQNTKKMSNTDPPKKLNACAREAEAIPV